MLEAVIWGLVQGLTEFLPVSSSGHLVVIPAFLSRLGMDVRPPPLAVSAVLHLGTLLAVLVYYREDVGRVLRFRSDGEGRRIALVVGVGTVPALIGLPLADTLDRFQQTVSNVGWALIATGMVLVLGQRLATGRRHLEEAGLRDAVIVGVAQAFALIPGVSRSGMTITGANSRRFEPTESARFAFLLGIPAIAGGGFSQVLELSDTGGVGGELIVALAVAALSGYAAIALLLAVLRRVGLAPFALYCFLVGTATILAF